MSTDEHIRRKGKHHDEESHPVGTGVGAVSGGAVGAAVGTAVGGPVGGVVGAAIGAIAGGMAGYGVADAMDPTDEDEYWRTNFHTRPYVTDDSYEMYRPAYVYGWDLRRRTLGTGWDEIEDDIEQGWDRFRDRSDLAWDRAQHAARDGWNRVEQQFESMFDDEDEYWQTHYRTRPYVTAGEPYETYEPAYSYGYRERVRRLDQRWDDAEGDLERGWDRFRSHSRLTWQQAKDAVRDAWHHVERALPGDFDRDGR